MVYAAKKMRHKSRIAITYNASTEEVAVDYECTKVPVQDADKKTDVSEPKSMNKNLQE